MVVRVSSRGVKRENSIHTDFTNMVECPGCGKKIFVPFKPNGSEGRVKVIFRCVFCDTRIETIITH